MQLLRRILARSAFAPRTVRVTATRHGRCEALADAALAFATDRVSSGVEDVLRATVRAAAAISGGAVLVVLVDRDGRLERFSADGADGCTRETVSRPEVLAALVARLRALGRPLGPDDLDGASGRLLAAIAPRGFLALPLGPSVSAVLLVVEPSAGAGLDDEAVRAVTVLSMLAGAALRNARRLARLEESREELRRLAAHVLVSRDHELGRTSHALHEGICQGLAAANAHLQALDPLLDGDPVGVRAGLRDARTLVKQALGELRELAQDLRPPVLAAFGYVHALRWYLTRLRERAGVAHSLEVEGDDTRLPLELEGALYRATEEALCAVARSKAMRPLHVRFRQDRATVHVEIAGPEPEALNVGAMREGLRAFGGAVEVRSTPDAATVIEMSVRPPVN